MQVNVEGVDSVMETIYEAIQNKITQNKSVILTTTLSKEKKGSIYSFARKILEEEDLKKEENLSFLTVLRDGKPNFINESSKEEVVTLAEPFYPRERLIVLGGGHIALPLVEIASRVGFQVTVVDDRPSFANVARFPTAEKVICESFQKCFDEIKITRNDYIVIITRGHRHDTESLRQILKEPETVYVGMIGSKRRVGVVKEELILEGFEEDRLNRVCTPIGLSIGAATPEEISISIVGELIKRKRIDRSEQFMVNRSDLDSYMLEILAKPIKERCSLVTILSTKGSVPRGVGAKMLVTKSGQIFGSIGGGCSESAIMRTALEIIGSGKWLIEEIDMTADAAEEEGMVCGGIMTVLIEDMECNFRE
jgi:xanthine dehydrogenase accessory factor